MTRFWWQRKFKRTCDCCGSGFMGHAQAVSCRICSHTRFKAGCIVGAYVNLARSRGLLPKPSDFRCVDCGVPAHGYDHRDYRKPLKIEPVCRGCNSKRGHAKPFDGRSTKWRRPEVILPYLKRLHSKFVKSVRQPPPPSNAG